MIYPVILAGGSGSRLWPLSRSSYPKQFLPLGSDISLLQQTLFRAREVTSAKALVVCNNEHRFIAAEQLRTLTTRQGYDTAPQILIEPQGKNTAPAVALAAFQLLNQNSVQPAVMLVLPADHQIADNHAFSKAIRQLLPEVNDGRFGTLGIVPTEPHCGYGYIQVSSQFSEAVARVKRFIEKPDQDTAEGYLKEQAFISSEHGSYKWLWNSGMFVIRADRYLEELKRLKPDIYSACKNAVETGSCDFDFIRVNERAFSACPADSIDYALMESLAVEGKVVVSPLDAGWSDIGSWASLSESYPSDKDRNILVGKSSESRTLLKDTRNSVVYSDRRLVATLGVKDLIIADTEDALLVADKSREQDVRTVVTEIQKLGLREADDHHLVYRPWGFYDTVIDAAGYKVKKIQINSGAAISLQRHGHRAEHWVVVSGCAQVTRGNEVYPVKANQSTFIPVGEVHKLENLMDEPLIMIEVQTGDYLSEDDIERLEDRYGRE